MVHHHESECYAKKWDSAFKVKITERAYIYNQNMMVFTVSFILNNDFFCTKFSLMVEHQKQKCVQ